MMESGKRIFSKIFSPSIRDKRERTKIILKMNNNCRALKLCKQFNLVTSFNLNISTIDRCTSNMDFFDKSGGLSMSQQLQQVHSHKIV